jgi:hypothetical protein
MQVYQLLEVLTIKVPMAKINVYVPEPPAEYTTEGFRQINQAIETVENQLNTSYQQDLKNEQDAFNYFMS